VQCSEVKGREVKIFGEICVLSLIYGYVVVCRFCVVRRLVIICFPLLFSNYSTYVFNILFMFVFCFVCLLSILCILCFCIVCVMFLLLYRALYYVYTGLLTTATRWKPNCSEEMYIISYIYKLKKWCGLWHFKSLLKLCLLCTSSHQILINLP